MNINVNAAAIAGTSRAAAKGGESDSQATNAARQQATAEAPGGKAADSAEIDASDQAGDRGGNGQQILDIFQRDEDEDATEEQPSGSSEQPAQQANPEGSGSNLDLQA